MQRQIVELTGARAVADAQVDEPRKMVDVAEAQRDLAELQLLAISCTIRIL